VAEVEKTEASEVPGATIGAFGEKGRLNSLSTKNVMQRVLIVNGNEYLPGNEESFF
jgi:hypothetical protein